MKGTRILNFLSNTILACDPAYLDQIYGVIELHMAGATKTVAKTRANPAGFITAPNIAVIPITGSIAKEFYGLDAISTSQLTTHDIVTKISEAEDDPNIDGSILYIDSPGGTADGTIDVVDAVKNCTKPIVAFVSGSACSAAYWIAASTRHITASRMSNLGSVGVFTKHVDITEALQDEGLKVKYFYKGTYKALGASDMAMPEEHVKELENRIDTIYTLFVNEIKELRGIESEKIINEIGLSKVYIATEAIKLNLVDSIGGFDTAVENLNNLINERKSKVDEAQTNVQQLTNIEAALSDLQTANKTLLDSNASLQEELKAMKAEKAQKDKAEFVKSAFTFELSEGMTVLMESLPNEHISAIAELCNDMQNRITAITAEMHNTTENATTSEGVELPKTADAAVMFVKTRDNVDINEAYTKAQAEFPTLFKRK